MPQFIAAVVTGFVLMVADEDLIGYGFLIWVGGPLFSLISFWILYAFGELVEKTCDNEENTREIIHLLKKKNPDLTALHVPQTQKYQTPK